MQPNPARKTRTAAIFFVSGRLELIMLLLTPNYDPSPTPDPAHENENPATRAAADGLARMGPAGAAAHEAVHGRRRYPGADRQGQGRAKIANRQFDAADRAFRRHLGPAGVSDRRDAAHRASRP